MSDPVALAIIGMMAATVSAVVALVGKIVTRRLDRADANAQRREARIIEVAGEVYEIGQKVDGRLEELLRTARAASHAEGITAGEKAERDRSEGGK